MKNNQLKTGLVLSYISMAAGYIVMLIYTPIMLCFLGQSDYGLYNLAAAVVAYLGILNFGFGSSYIRFYSRYKVKDAADAIATLNGMFMIVFSFIGVIAVTAGIVMAFNVEHIFGSSLTIEQTSRSKILLLILVVNLAFSFPNMVFNSYITANEKFTFLKVIQIIKVVIGPFITIPALVLGYGSIGMVVTTTCLNAVLEITNVIYCVHKLNMRFNFNRFDWPLMKEMTKFSSYIFIGIVIDQINWNVDKYILGRLHGTVTVAVYALAAQLNIYYISASTAISNVFVPRVHKLIAISNNQDLTALFTKIGRMQFIALSLIVSMLVFFGKYFIRIWAGPDYNESYYIVLLLAIPVTIPLIQNIGIEIQKAKNMHQFRSWIYLGMAIVNVCLTIPLAMRYQGIGAAIGTAISLIIGNGIIMNWYYHKKIGLDIICFWENILGIGKALVLPVLAGIVVTRVIENRGVVLFVLMIIVYTLTFGVSMWLFGMNQYEKNIVSTPLRKILKRV